MTKNYKIITLEWTDFQSYNNVISCKQGFFMIKKEIPQGYSLSYCFEEYYNEGSIHMDTLDQAKIKAQEIFNNQAIVFLEEVN